MMLKTLLVIVVALAVASQALSLGAVRAPKLKRAPAAPISTIPRKALAGPPSEFAQHALPNPASLAVISDTALFEVNLKDTSSGTASVTQVLSVDSMVGFAFSVYSPIESKLNLQLLDPKGAVVDLTQHAHPASLPLWDNSEMTIPSTGYYFSGDSFVRGDYKLTITAPSTVSAVNSEIESLTQQLRHIDDPQAYVVLYNEGTDPIASHLISLDLRQNQEGGLAAFITPAASVNSRNFTAKQNVVTTAQLEAVFPDGVRVRKPMRDDGQGGDNVANDGVYHASIVFTEVGSYVLQSLLAGTDDNGPFVRTVEHFVEVLPPLVQLTGQASGTVKDHTLVVNLGVKSLSAETQQRSYRAYFELQGTAHGARTPVGWFSSIVDVVSTPTGDVVSLLVDVDWIARAQVKAPFTLTNVYMQDVTTWIPLTEVAEIPLHLQAPHAAVLALRVQQSTFDGTITPRMRWGMPPATSNLSGPNGPYLVLLHGYCADRNPWQVQSEDWTDAIYYLDAKQGIAHDEYAQKVVAWAAAQGATSYGLVGHSQGGLVSLHILNYYHTPLDNAVGNRKVQSLASPYGGTSAAGGLAELGDLLGLGCGPVYDMTPEGSALWRAGLSQAAIEQLSYYTTQYDKGALGGGYCNLLINLLISKPNDGTVEVSYSTIEGGNHRSHVIGQCHIDGMNWPASYWDKARNAEINANAAR